MKLCSAKYHFVGASHDKTLYPGMKSPRSIKTGEYKRQNSKITGISASKASDDFMIWPRSVQRMLHSAEKTIKSASSAISVTFIGVQANQKQKETELEDSYTKKGQTIFRLDGEEGSVPFLRRGETGSFLQVQSAL